MEVVLNISGSSLSKRQKLLLMKDAQSIIDKFGKKFTKAQFKLRVKAHEAKKLVQVKGRLITDKGQYYSESEGWRKGFTCFHALEGIRAQLQRQTI